MTDLANKGRKLILISLLLCSLISNAQNSNLKTDSTFFQEIYSEALNKGEAYENLHYLSKKIGHRLSGSLGAEMAVRWGEKTLKDYHFDKVYLQKVMVPNWKRGNAERAFYISKKGDIQQINILALGGSVGTDGILEAPLVMVKTFEEISNAPKDAYKGRIVFIAQAMESSYPSAFTAYGKNAKIRGLGAIEAAKKGAVGVIIRSLSLSENDFPNTGGMRYEENTPKIPAAAISTNDATALEKIIREGEQLVLAMEMDCKTLPDITSYNVIGEITGSKYPHKIITVGGHLDSWDVGEGAHDDGAGIVQSMEALRLLKVLKYQPKHTLRVVFFMNEENGNRGGITYAEQASLNKEEHLFALESDAGGFTPRGFEFSKTEHLAFFKKHENLFSPYYLTHSQSGRGGVDISPLGNKFDSIGLIGLVPDSQRYFDIHHNHNDVFENVNKRELHLGAAGMASLIYLLDKYYE